jgi:hypothetical protein
MMATDTNVVRFIGYPFDRHKPRHPRQGHHRYEDDPVDSFPHDLIMLQMLLG